MTRHLNQTQLLPIEQINEFCVGIIGMGAIGSFIAMALSKMGISAIAAWDDDKIEDHNIANQMFPVLDVGKRKALATRAMVEQFSGEKIITLAVKATGKVVVSYLSKAFPNKTQIVILAVDSLDVRKAIVEELKGQSCYVIDARMGAKTYRVMGFQAWVPEQVNAYMATIVADTAAVQERCGQKSIIYTVLGVAAEVCGFLHYVVMRNTLADYRMPAMPNPVIFDYGTGLRMQKQMVGEVVSL